MGSERVGLLPRELPKGCKEEAALPRGRVRCLFPTSCSAPHTPHLLRQEDWGQVGPSSLGRGRSWSRHSWLWKVVSVLVKLNSQAGWGHSGQPAW